MRTFSTQPVGLVAELSTHARSFRLITVPLIQSTCKTFQFVCFIRCVDVNLSQRVRTVIFQLSPCLSSADECRCSQAPGVSMVVWFTWETLITVVGREDEPVLTVVTGN